MCFKLPIVLMSHLIGFTWRRAMPHNYTHWAPASLQDGLSVLTRTPRWEHRPAFSKASHSVDTREKPACSHDPQRQSREKLRARLANIDSHKSGFIFPTWPFPRVYFIFIDWRVVVCIHKAHNLLLHVLCVGLILESGIREEEFHKVRCSVPWGWELRISLVEI